MRARASALLVFGLATASLAPPIPSLAQAAQAAAGEDGCRVTMSPALLRKWRDEGGQARLGCPIARESDAAPSPTGATARVLLFQQGELVAPTSGARAGAAVAVLGCFWRLYFQYRGSAGWLGLPLADAVTTQDGARQDFEGGSLLYQRDLDRCIIRPERGSP
ncbi:MAG TPA: hypothetical protein VGS12_17570 [Caulobacteraceae bacterium]|nr:hypothetical protein [Caulobacteraceae bacterium]